jgi:hypothetical protein
MQSAEHVHEFHLMVDRAESVAAWDGEPIVVRPGEKVHIDAFERCIAVQLLAGATPRLVIVSDGPRVLLNGHPAPAIAVARAGDEVAVDGFEGVRLHLALYRPGAVRSAGEELCGRECALCLTRFSAENRVFVCSCGTALHVDDGELNCARAVMHCPDCRREIRLNSSYEDLPHDDYGRQILPRRRIAAAAV